MANILVNGFVIAITIIRSSEGVSDSASRGGGGCISATCRAVETHAMAAVLLPADEQGPLVERQRARPGLFITLIVLEVVVVSTCTGGSP